MNSFSSLLLLTLLIGVYAAMQESDVGHHFQYYDDDDDDNAEYPSEIDTPPRIITIHANPEPQQLQSEGQEIDVIQCSRHANCPNHLACFTDFKCRDPCIESVHGLQCRRNEMCIVDRHFPTCGPNNGDPENIVGPGPRPPPPPPPRGDQECVEHTDCPDHLTCFVDNTCRDSCTMSRHGLPCSNAECQVVNHRPTCRGGRPRRFFFG